LRRPGKIVPVDRAEVAEAEFLEEHPVLEECLQPIAELLQGRVGHLADHRDVVQIWLIRRFPPW
jgi:hypothetical protein